MRPRDRPLARFLGDAPVPMYWVSPEGAILWANRAALSLLGWEPERFIGRPLAGFHEKASLAKKLMYLWRDGKGCSGFSARLRCRDGSLKALLIDSDVLRERGRTVLARCYARDMSRETNLLRELSERKRIESDLQRRTEELSRSNAELSLFATIASHDLQEPLRKITAFGDRLRLHLSGKLDAQGQDYLGRMQKSAERMARLVEDLLKLARVTSKGQPLREVDLKAVIRDILSSDMETTLSLSRGRVEVGPLPRIRADPSQMRQLFQNLIGNALKFRGPGTAPLVLVEGVDLGNGFVEVSVKDNGVGFDEKYLDRLFKPFQRLHSRQEYEGNGIGLAICAKIALRHGGMLAARSAPGRGARFTLTLPNPYGTRP